MHGLPWEVSGAVWRTRLPHRQRWGKALEKSAEAIVVPAGRDEGPNPLLQGASRENLMGIERRQGTVYQLSLLEWRRGGRAPRRPW